MTALLLAALIAQPPAADPPAVPQPPATPQPPAVLQPPAAGPADRLAEELAKHAGRRPVLVVFGAKWCAPCKKMAPFVTGAAVAAARDPAHLIEVDLDANRPAVERLDVRSVPTVIAFDKAGREVARTAGGMGEADLAAWVRAAFAPKPPAAVGVRADDRAGTNSFGSGTVVLAGGRRLVLTNRHVVAGRSGLAVFVDGREIAARLVRASDDPAVDLAVLAADGLPEPAAVAEAVPPVGTRVRVWGHLRGRLRGLLRVGQVDQRTADSSLWTTVGCSHGDSGAGLFDDDGRLVGVALGFTTGAELKDCVGVPTDRVRAFLASVRPGD